MVESTLLSMQPTPNKKIQELADKWLKGTISEEEKHQLEAWYRQPLPDQMEWPADDADEGALSERLLAGVQANIEPRVRVIPFWKRPANWAAAAVLFMLFSTATYYWQHFLRQPLPTTLTQSVTPPPNDIAPGGNRAVLTLADQSQIMLDGAKNGMLAKEGNTAIEKIQHGQIAYQANQQSASPVTPQMNTLTTPRGGQYQLILPDGTHVWLNAASSLRFPTAFTGSERRVELTGEAYFEVAKNAAQPFKVQLKDDVEIQVLGTHFNVMAYDDEQAIRTTLLEGGVKVSQRLDSKTIKPGQQAKVAIGAGIRVAAADTEEAVAWKNGYFRFNRSDLPTLMRQIARWYDVEVEYQGKIPTDEFVGKISRNEKLSGVLRILQLSRVHYRLEGRKIIVIP